MVLQQNFNMSIHFRSGKPGGGKTLKAVSDIVAILLSDDKRVIVTNIPLDLDKLQHYLHDLGSTVHVMTRVYLLSEEETFYFYLHRGPLRIVMEPVRKLTAAEKKAGVDSGADIMPDYAESIAHPVAGLGIIYFIDEIHLFFNSREWQDTGKRAIYYLSQHRKLNDVVHCITQSIQNVDGQFRRLAQDFSYVRNHRVEKFKGFRRGDGFVELVYLQPVLTGNEEPCTKNTFKLDLKLASVYSTAGGVGLPGGNSADGGKIVKGFPLKTLYYVIGAIVVSVFLILIFLPRIVKKGAASFVKPPAAATSNSGASGSSPVAVPAAAKPSFKVSGSIGTISDWKRLELSISERADGKRNGWHKVISLFDSRTLVLDDGTKVDIDQLP